MIPNECSPLLECLRLLMRRFCDCGVVTGFGKSRARDECIACFFFFFF